jgi:hypothetical protein
MAEEELHLLGQPLVVQIEQDFGYHALRKSDFEENVDLVQVVGLLLRVKSVAAQFLEHLVEVDDILLRENLISRHRKPRFRVETIAVNGSHEYHEVVDDCLRRILQTISDSLLKFKCRSTHNFISTTYTLVPELDQLFVLDR